MFGLIIGIVIGLILSRIGPHTGLASETRTKPTPPRRKETGPPDPWGDGCVW